MLTFFLIIKYNVFVDGSIVYKKITHTLSDDYVYVGDDKKIYYFRSGSDAYAARDYGSKYSSKY